MKKKCFRKIVIANILLATVLFSHAVLAISPDNHQHVTRLSSSIYKDCLKQLGVADSLYAGLEIIAAFSGEEDLSPILTRSFNWHFFDAYRDNEEYAMGRHFTGARKSLHHIYDKRADALIEALDNGRETEVFEYTGRLLHYIQDMTVPAHVAPIFHYVFPLIDRSDYFDEMPEWGTTPFSGNPETCLVKKDDNETLKQWFNNILNTTANETRYRIQQQIPLNNNHPLSGKTWEELWVIRKPQDDRYEDIMSGFAPYGNQGKDGFEKLCNGSDREREACIGFFTRSFNMAIVSTVQTLLLINSINLKNNDQI